MEEGEQADIAVMTDAEHNQKDKQRGFIETVDFTTCLVIV